jgi:lambda family phage minor tail protein L
MTTTFWYVQPDYWVLGYAEGDGFYGLLAEIQKVAPSAIIELFVLELNLKVHGVTDVYRFHAGTNATGSNGNVVWAGNTYQAFPIEAEGFEYSGNGQLPRPKIRVSNIMGTVTALILSLPSGLEGAKVTRIRTLARYLDAVNFPGSVNPYGTPDSTAQMPLEVFYIDRKSVENRDVVEYEMCASFDLVGVRSPKRQCISNICQWEYRSTECGYTAAGYYDANDEPVSLLSQDVCGKRLSSCKARFLVRTFTGSVTVGSNVWTTASTTTILPGEPIRGWGLPTGTTVSTVASATTLTLSNVATASSSSSKTGTVSASAATMTVANTTGLAVGMAVAGSYLSGASIVGISGTTLTLNQRPYQVYKTATAFVVSAIFSGIIFTTRSITIDTTGLSVGMRVFGSAGIDTTIATIGTGSITLASYGNLPANGTPLGLYFIPPSPAASTYTFTADTTYAFRDPSNELPFGSFPGVGGYST